MKVLYFDGTKLSKREDFPTPGSGESLVKVTMVGICGTDLELLKGYMSFSGIPGHEFVGKVVKSDNKDLIGKKVVGEINVGCGKCESCLSGMERHCPNRTVLGIHNRNGAFAEYLTLPEKNLHVIPDSIKDEQAVFVEPLAASFEILEQIKIDPKWHIAIVGDGRLAQLIARVLHISCHDITCFGRHKRKLDLLGNVGVHTKTDISSVDEHNFDLVIEATGNESGFSDTLRLVKPRGTVILKSTIASRNKLDLSPAVVNEVTFLGSRCGPFNPAVEALISGNISVEELVDAVYPLDSFNEAFQAAGKRGALKILMKP